MVPRSCADPVREHDVGEITASPGTQARSINRSKLLWFVAAVTGLGLLGLVAFLAQTLVSERGSMAAILLQEHVYWSASQTNVEALRFRDALHRFAAGDPAVEGRDLTMRFDILWSRLHLFDEGILAQRLTEIPDGLARQQRILALLDSMDATLPGVLGGEPTDRILALSDEMVRITHGFAVDINLYETMGLARLGEQLRTDLWIMAVMATLIAVGATAATVLVAMLGRMRRTRFMADAMTLLDIAAAPVLVTDSAGHVLRWNPAIMTATGIESPDARSATLESLLEGPTAAERARRLLAAAMSGERTAAAVLRFQTQDGKGTDIEFGASALTDDTGRRIILLIGQDLGERDRHRMQVTRMRHLAELGTVASTLAHELKQPLNAVRLAAENALARIRARNADMHYLEQKLERIGRLTGRTNAILEHIAHYNADAGAPPTEVDLREIAHRAVDVFEDELRKSGIGISIDDQEGIPSGMGRAKQLERILVNLISNARDALVMSGTDDGRIVLRTGWGDPGMVFIEVEDNGPGIPDDLAQEVFEPFFTTKPAGSGTGLGLAMSAALAKEHGGRLDYRTIHPHGTVMRLELPSGEGTLLPGGTVPDDLR